MNVWESVMYKDYKITYMGKIHGYFIYLGEEWIATAQSIKRAKELINTDIQAS
jgi:hypothetical protein